MTPRDRGEQLPLWEDGGIVVLRVRGRAWACSRVPTVCPPRGEAIDFFHLPYRDVPRSIVLLERYYRWQFCGVPGFAKLSSQDSNTREP